MVRSIFAAGLCGVLFCQGLPGAAEDDVVRKYLDDARSAYDRTLKEYREEVAIWWESEDEAARKLKSGVTEKVKQVAAEKKEFEEKGVLPKRVPSSLRDKLAKAAEAMVKAYKAASDEYSRQKFDDKAAGVEKELEAFRKGTLPRAGEERSFEIADGTKMVFCWIPAGEATLGSPANEKEREAADDAEHSYSTKGFWMGKYLVTQKEYEAVTGGNPSRFAKTGNNADFRKRVEGMDTSRFPVEMVSWDDCQVFLAKLNKRDGVAKVFGKPGKFALPHEDAWEYAYRGGKGNKQPFYWGTTLNGDKANCDGAKPYGTKARGTYLKRTTEVGAYAKVAPHPWGLCDMAGNVCQWCDNVATRDGRCRIVRGGSFPFPSLNARGASHIWYGPDLHTDCVGFRVCIFPE